MKTTTWRLALAVLVSGPGACSFDIADPNSPEPLPNDPSREQIQGAVNGLLIGARADYADWVLEAGIVGREAYRFDASDPRWADELLVGPFDPGNIRFGGDHWLEQYRNIRAANRLLEATAGSTVLSPTVLSALQGFVKTVQALDLLMVLNAHEDSVPIDVESDPVDDPPAPLVDNEVAWARAVTLLDDARTSLVAAGGASFPFQLTSGFAGFSAPAEFLKFNRALKARVEIYRASLGHTACGVAGATCYNAALVILQAPESTFLSTTASLDVGVYHVYGTGGADVANPLFEDTASAIQHVHPSIKKDADTTSSGVLDRRFVTKVAETDTAEFGDPLRTSALVWIRYQSNIDPVPIIRNEELFLLQAEAENALGAGDLGHGEVNFIRRVSGGLDTMTTVAWAALTTDQRLDQILKERRYSLLFEGGHRWIDARRTNRLTQLPLDYDPGDVVHRSWPIPFDACLARGKPPDCG